MSFTIASAPASQLLRQTHDRRLGCAPGAPTSGAGASQIEVDIDARPLRVLLLEDCEADAQLILYELRRAGLDPAGQRVDTEADFLAHLEATPEIILADQNIPQFSAPLRHSLLQERGLDVPIIVITGGLGDEAVVECLKQGACDYLLKHRLARLGQAVVHALDEKQMRDGRQRAKAALRESEARKTAILETVPVGIITIDEHGTIESFKPAAEKIFGYSVTGVRGCNIKIRQQKLERPITSARADDARFALLLALDHLSKEFPRVAIPLTEVISIRTSRMTRPTP